MYQVSIFNENKEYFAYINVTGREVSTLTLMV